MTDLAGIIVTLFIFGECYDAHWKQYAGAVIAVLCPAITNTSIKVSRATQVVHLGYSQGNAL